MEAKYKYLVTKANLDEKHIDDSEFVLDGSNYENYGNYMELLLLEEYRDGMLIFQELKNNGLKSVQGPSRVKEELHRYIEESVEKEQVNELNYIVKEIETMVEY